MGLLLVTHDVELAARLADTVLVMKRGQIVAAGPPREVFEEYPEFGPQMSRLFPGRGWLTVDDAVTGMKSWSRSVSNEAI